MALSRDNLLQLRDFKTKTVSVPAWEGKEVVIRTLSALQRDQLERIAQGNGGVVDNIRSRMAAMSLCDEAGNLLFTPEEYELVGQVCSGEALEFLLGEIMSLNAMGDKKSAEEVEKNSEAIPGEDSTTA